MARKPSPVLEQRLTWLEQTVNALTEAYIIGKDPSTAIEPLFEMEVVATLVPIEIDRLKHHLANHAAKYPKIYRLDRDRRRRRLLPISSIKAIRAHCLRGPDLEAFL